MTDLPTDLPPLSAGDFEARAGRESAAADVAQAPFVRRVIVGLLIAGALNFGATGASVLFATEARNSAGQLRAMTLENRAVIRHNKAVQMAGRHEFCQLFQRSHHAAVRQLRQTIVFLEHPDGLQGTVVKAIRKTVPQLRSDVTTSALPKVCATVLAPTNHHRPRRTPSKYGRQHHIVKPHVQYRSNP